MRYNGVHWLRYTGADGLLNAPIHGVSQTDDGSLWFYSSERDPWKFRGISRYQDGAWKRYTSEEIGLDRVRSPNRILRAFDGSFWITGSRNGASAVSRYDGQNWRTYTHEDGLPGEYLTHIYQADNGDLWFDARPEHGVIRYDGTHWVSYTTKDGLSHNRAGQGIYQTSDGTVWVGTLNGLSWFDGAVWHNYTYEDGLSVQKPRGFVVDDGDLWFADQASFGSGVVRYDGKTWRTYTVQDGLVDNRVRSIYRATDGALWFATMGGISRFDGTNWTGYTEEDGLPGSNIIKIWQSSDGTLWFLTHDGQAGMLTPDTHGPETALEPTPEAISSVGNILLRWSGRDLWDDTSPEDMLYRWRLDGGDWSPASHRTDHTFTSLPSGEHTFEVRAMDQDMNIDPTPAAHAFVVEPPWWRNPYVLGLATLLLRLVGVQTGRIIRRDRLLRTSNAALSEANKELFGLNRELQQKTEDLERDRAVERIRGEVQAMDRASDFEKVLSLVSEELKAVGLSFDICGIDVLDEPLEAPTMAHFEEHGFRYTAYKLDPAGRLEQESYHLAAPFPDVNREMIERFVAGQPWQVLVGGTNAIVEVPISGYGRLRLTTSDRQAFTDEDTDALRDFASAIALGYARYLDIREIQEQTQRKSAFLASMSHELRTPMNAIIGFTRMVLRRAGDALPERQKENLNRVLLSGGHLLDLINDILDMSKIEAGRMDVTPERFDVKKLIAGCCAELSPLFAEKPDVKLDYEVPDTIGEAHTDQGRLRQIVRNLLSNAIKFTERGEVAVRASREGEHLTISVSDTGTGIPADALESIFEEFQQVKGSDPQHKGTGLGLPICKGFAELLGGSIHVESEVGKGSTFTIRIPTVYRES